MSGKLANIRKLGRYQNNDSGRCVNIHIGRKVGYGVDVLFWLYRGKRNFISDRDFHDGWEQIK